MEENMYKKEFLGLVEAEVATRAILAEAAKEASRPITVVVTDARGDIIILIKMDGGKALFNEWGIKKAVQSGTLGLDTRQFFLNRMKKELADDWGLYEPPGDGRTFVPGGVAIVEPGANAAVVYGGIGVSGRRADEDEALAFIGLKALQNFLWHK
jgi:uncharacterized protein GlcG (DUF336 family)